MTNPYTPIFGTYSFMDVQAVISGPGVDNMTIGGPQILAGPQAASGEEGVTITLTEETNTQMIGADGSVMNSLHASRASTAVFRLLKTSPQNKALMRIYNYQRVQSSLWGRNTITIRDVARGDEYTLHGCSFVRFPANSYAKTGNTLEWEFACSLTDALLGDALSYFSNTSQTPAISPGAPGTGL